METNPYLTTNCGLTDAQFALIGKTICNWSIFDVIAGQALNRIYGLATAEASAELVQVVDTKKKVDLLRKASKRKPYVGNETLGFKEVLECYNLWHDDRNMIAHGVFVFSRENPPYLASSKRGFMDSGHDLQRMHDRSVHIADAMMRLLFALDGQPLQSSAASRERPV